MLKAQNLTRRYGEGERSNAVIKQLNLEMLPGEFIAVTGPSGAGKSTLLSLMSGLDKPDEGSVWFQNINVSLLTPKELARVRNQYFGFVFQTPHYIAYKSVLENVMLPFQYQQEVTHQRALRIASELLEYVGIGELAQREPATLSGGELQRMVFARAVVNQPKVIFADEPTGSLDADNSKRILDLLADQAAQGNIVMMVTHDQEAALKAHRQLELKK